MKAHPHIHFHFTPTSASWLNQVEGLFGILTRQSLRPTDFPSKAALTKHLRAFFAQWNLNPRPFVWTKKAYRIVKDHSRIIQRISVADH